MFVQWATSIACLYLVFSWMTTDTVCSTLAVTTMLMLQHFSVYYTDPNTVNVWLLTNSPIMNNNDLKQ